MLSDILDMARINDWCVRYGKYHKRLNDHNHVELAALVSQFDRVYKSFLAAI